MSNDLRRGRHCVFNLHVHLVFVTKYRRKIFKKHHLIFLENVFINVCKDFESRLSQFDGESDHVHLLVHYPTKHAISKIVNSLKGVSSRMLRTRFEDLRKHYYKGVLWSPSYFAASCGGAPISVVKQYIQNQKTPAT